MFFFSPSQGLVEHILVISYGIIVGNYVKRKKKWCLMKKHGQSCQRWKKKKVFLMFLRFYVERSLNQKKLSIGN
jgi:hypothetical protein